MYAYLLTYLLTQGVAGGVQLEGISCSHNCSGRLEYVTVPSQVTLNVIIPQAIVFSEVT